MILLVVGALVVATCLVVIVVGGIEPDPHGAPFEPPSMQPAPPERKDAA